MNAREYFETVVQPIFERLKQEPNALELQVATTTIIFHAADHIAETKHLTVPEVRNVILKQVPEFEAVWAASIANKHQVIRRDPASQKGLTSPHQNTPNYLTLNGARLTLYGSNLTLGTTSCIVLQDGSEVPLLQTLQRVMAVLDQES